MPISYTSRHVPDQAFVPPYILCRAAPGPRTFARGPVNSVKVYGTHLTQGVEAVGKVIRNRVADEHVEEMPAEGAEARVLALDHRRHEEEHCGVGPPIWSEVTGFTKTKH
jgi:hypothetical protein